MSRTSPGPGPLSSTSSYPATSSLAAHQPTPSASAATDPYTKRLLQELNAQSRSPLPACIVFLRPVSDARLDRWEAVLRGVEGTGYEYGQWHLTIHIPKTYPHSPPKIKFNTPICHPNISFQSGEICLDLLNLSSSSQPPSSTSTSTTLPRSPSGWTPVYTLSSTLEAIHMLLRYPDVESPLNVDVAVLLRNGDRVGAEALVRWCCGEWRWDGRDGR